MAGGIDHGPREELGSAGRIRALRDASGPFGTRQGPSGRVRALRDASGPFGTRQGPPIRARALRDVPGPFGMDVVAIQTGGGGAFGPWPLATIKNKSP